MNGLTMLMGSFAVLLAAYFIYGRFLERKWGTDEQARTPAHEFNDGVDYVPARRSVVFGHEFASIAGAGPINGPIIAAMFGWMPALIWILAGGIFFGAVQDFAALYASVKNKGRTIGYIIELYIGKTGKRLFLLFVWLFSILVIAAFADIVAGTFDGFGSNAAQNEANAAVASTSILFMLAAVGLGFYLFHRKPGGGTSALAAIVLLTACIAAGLACPIYMDKGFWLHFVFAYIFVASITPVWALLQPRDYLNSFLLVALIAGAFIGIVVSNPTMHIVPFAGFTVNDQQLFPILFVTIACGAVSGFHSLVASGTASKQVDNERDMLPISFGAMLLESLLAVISLVAVGALAVGGVLPSGTPPVVFATAVAGFLAAIGIPQHMTYTVITLAVAAFALTSLDSVARVGRLAFQEVFTDSLADTAQMHPLYRLFSNRYLATAVTLLMGYLLSLRGYMDIWPLFGSANQLLAALSLIACAVFLKKTHRAGAMLYLPMVSMLVITFTALGLTIDKLLGKMSVDGAFQIASDGIQLLFAVLLLALGILVAVAGIAKLRGTPEERPTVAAEPL
ncbi:MAG: carbon starvation protein A [Desulfobulbus sp.]|jgi:carbon starvation protein|uniref:carbon starvation CstA family protein n=1 Tax=Desulfobulbus sp. TaxID=895 RepID=UPI0028518F1F|nr:carbon starvation protein A [Desulfobulbus sp.]MDR2548864.1 carbon starvation protein A [Desulfobulbus sp.]